jgi:hypothetical protein
MRLEQCSNPGAAVAQLDLEAAFRAVENSERFEVQAVSQLAQIAMQGGRNCFSGSSHTIE